MERNAVPSHLEPDTDNADVGSHIIRFVTGSTVIGCFLFLFLQLKMRGSLCCQAERKESPSTLIPDMDNAIVGSQNIIDSWGYPDRVSPFFYFNLLEKRC